MANQTNIWRTAVNNKTFWPWFAERSNLQLFKVSSWYLKAWSLGTLHLQIVSRLLKGLSWIEQISNKLKTKGTFATAVFRSGKGPIVSERIQAFSNVAKAEEDRPWFFLFWKYTPKILKMCILRLEKFLIHASPYNTTREFSIQVPVVCQTFLVFMFSQCNVFYQPRLVRFYFVITSFSFRWHLQTSANWAISAKGLDTILSI